MIMQSTQRILSLKVEVIGEDHEAAGSGTRRDASRRASEHEHLNTQKPEHSDRENDLSRREALVKVDAAFKDDDRVFPPQTHVQCTGLSVHRGAREVGYRPVGNPGRASKVSDYITQAGAQHDSDAGPRGQTLAQKPRCLPRLAVTRTAGTSDR